jgi:hypothetical protein
VFAIAVAVPIVLILLLAFELLFRWFDRLGLAADKRFAEHRRDDLIEHAARYHRIDTKDLHKDDSA